MSNRPNDDQLTALRALANRWAMNARDYSRDSKSPKADPEKAAYNRGLADAFYKAALDLANILKQENINELGTAAPPVTRPVISGQPKPGEQTITFATMTVGEAIRYLEFVGASPRDVNVRRDNTIYAVFSRWQPMTEQERITKIKNSDPRVIVLGSGKVKDSADPYVEFAFKA